MTASLCKRLSVRGSASRRKRTVGKEGIRLREFPFREVMSFAQLHSARRSRQPKSYVAPTPSSSHAQSQDYQLEGISALIEGGREAENVAVESPSSSMMKSSTTARDGLYSLPPTLELRFSPKSGRGLYANQPIAPGTFLTCPTPNISYPYPQAPYSSQPSRTSMSSPPRILSRTAPPALARPLL